MSDFVTEIKPRSLVNSRDPSMRPKEDFVAEIRPKSHNETDQTRTNTYSYSQDETDLYVQKMLSDRQFSRESLVRLLESSVITLVEKLLTGRIISTIEGSLLIDLSYDESPLVIRFSKSFRKSSPCPIQQPLDSGLNVKIKDRETSFLYPPPHDKPDSSCSPCSDFSRDPCQSPTGSDASLHMWCHIDRDCSVTSPPQEYHLHSPPQECHLHSPPQECHLHSPPQECHPHSPPHESHISSSTHGSNASSPTHESYLARSRGDEKYWSLFPEHEKALPAMERCLSSESEQMKRSLIKLGTGCSYVTNENDSDVPKDVGDSNLGKDLFCLQTPQTINDGVCSRLDTKKSPRFPVVSLSNEPHSPESDCCGSFEEEMERDDDDADESDYHLVIDESPTDDLESTSSIRCNEVHDESRTSDQENMSGDGCLPLGSSLALSPKEDKADESLTNDMEDARSEAFLENVDDDSLDELPGNSKVTSDVMSLIPHPQSLVLKHADGFRCQRCNIFLPDTKAVAAHVHAVHDLYCCSYCCRTFTAKNNLKRHIRRHTGQRPYKCRQCPQTFSRQDDLKGHLIRHDYSKPFRCSVCKKGYTDRACVKNHMAKEHMSRDMHVCPPCGESFDGEEALTSHKRSHPELKQFSCPTCSFIGTNKLMTLKHSLVHSHKLFSCKPCNAYFSDPFQYTSHVKRHKKSTTFTHYVCCFCETTHTSYDQYIRHEYSHAQVKVHACKFCKKQFKNRSSLQDHVTTHKRSAGDKLLPERKTADHVGINKSHCQTWPSRSDKENLFFIPATSMTSEPDVQVLNRSRNLESKLPLPTTIEEDCGQLLDLSMKKAPTPPTPTLETEIVTDEKHKTENEIVRAAGQPVQDFPRNGVVNTGRACSSHQRGVKEERSASGQASVIECHGANISKAVFMLKDHQMAATLALCGSSLPPFPNGQHIAVNSARKSVSRSKSELAGQSRCGETAGAADRRAKSRAPLNDSRDRHSLLRLTPYSREKMVDLAAKFMAARGTRLTGHREPMKAIIPVGDDRTAIIIRDKEPCQRKMPSLTLTSDLKAIRHERPAPGETKRRDLAREAFNDNVEGMSDNTNSETTLRCHIPTVVKCEPLVSEPQWPEAALDCRFKKSKSDDVNTGLASGSRHGCGTCKEFFESFYELESHSVEIHKRYLCQHCRKSFTARPNRDRHVRYHTGERPYKCDLCDQAFYRGDDLKYHRTTRHPTAQPFVCTRCLASFTWGRDLERHIRHSKCNV